VVLPRNSFSIQTTPKADGRMKSASIHPAVYPPGLSDTPSPPLFSSFSPPPLQSFSREVLVQSRSTWAKLLIDRSPFLSSLHFALLGSFDHKTTKYVSRVAQFIEQIRLFSFCWKRLPVMMVMFFTSDALIRNSFHEQEVGLPPRRLLLACPRLRHL